MPVQDSVDMSAAWLAHAPPPPPPSTDVRKPRRSSSYEPMSAKSAGQMNDTHTRGGYLPPSSHSPEPSRQRRTSVEELRTAAASSSTPSSPVKRARSKVASNPVPPAPSAFYNYQHQLQQQQLHHRQREQSAPTPSQAPYPPAHELAYSQTQQQQQTQQQPPPQSVAMTYSHSDAASAPVHQGYARERRDSAPASTFANTQPLYNVAPPPQHPQHASAVSPVYTSHYATMSGPPVAVQTYAAPAPGGYAPHSMVPASHLQHLASHAPHYSVSAQQHQHWLPPQQGPPATQPGVPLHYYTAAPVPPPTAHPWDAPGMSATPPQQPGMVFPTTPNAMPPVTSPEMHAFPVTQMSPTPGAANNGAPVLPSIVSHAAYASDLSRQSTASSVGSVRRPLPQPTRTSSNPSAPGSPSTGTVGLSNRASVRRDLPRLPPGSPATISAASTFASSNLAKRDNSSPGSPDAATMSRLPPTALNRTESVRLAAEALMARGAPQRRPLRSALASTTFSPPLPATRTAASPLAQSSPLPTSQSEPAAAGTGASARTAAQYTAEVTPPSNPRGEPQSSQSDGSILASSVGSRTSPSGAQPANGYSHHAQHGVSSAPARYRDAMNQAAQHNQPQAPVQNHATQRQPTDELAASMNKMSVSQPATSPAPAKVEQPAVSIPVFSFDAPEAEPERPRRRRGSSVSRASPTPGHKVIQHTTAPSAVPTIVLPGDDDALNGPSIQVSGPDGDNGATSSAPTISISTDDDDARSQTSNGSRGPAISVSFSGEPAAKSQRAGTSHSPSSTPYGKRDADSGRVSASTVGSGAGCHGCRKWIAGKVVHALGTTFHPSCFVCAHCSEGLEHVAFYEHEGLPYCHFDYHELFSKRCFHCRTPIVDERYITVQDDELTGQDGETNERCYHELHFFCANCGDPFLDPKVAGSAAGSDPGQLAADENGKIKHGGMEFIVHKGYPYCEKCHVSLHKPRCKACKKPIVDDLISALGGKYHPECFTCTACAQPFSDTQFFVKDAKPYDEECYKVLLRNMI